MEILHIIWEYKGILFAVLILHGLWTVWDVYNHIQRLIQDVEQTRSNIAIVLEKKVEIINQFSVVVGRYDGHEKNIQLQVSNNYMQSAKEASKALAYIHGVAMAYPKLKSDNNYSIFLENISENEHALVEHKEAYNTTVKTYNTYISQLPVCFFAMLLHYKKEEYYSAQ